MIFKNFELNKINLKKNKFILLYGKNEGFKNQTVENLINKKDSIYNYDEKTILDNSNNFFENLLSKSLFESEKIIIIKRVTDKILEIILNLNEKNINDLIVILNSDNLEKKSKLRTYFEKHKEYICVPFYPDNEQTLSRLADVFFKEYKISLSSENINLIINKTNGDRGVLFKELEKIKFFSKNRKKISSENISKLINLAEDFSISELIDNCLAKNKKKMTMILNENNFNNEDSILITRIFLNKLKRILKLCETFENNKNIDLTISSAKPPIFWKDKEITKTQLNKWTSEDIRKLIYKLFEIELLIKKNLNNSINLIRNFITEVAIHNESNNKI